MEARDATRSGRRSPGWSSDAGEVVAVRLFMRWEFRRGGPGVRAVRAVDTATHPDHQGAGLFTALTRHALEACRAEAWRSCSTPRTSRAGPATSSSAGARSAASRPRCAPARRAHLVTIARSRAPAELWSVPIDVGADIASWLDGGGGAGRRPPRCRRRTGRCGRRRRDVRPLALRPRRRCTTAWSTTETPRSSCACAAAAPAGSSSSPTASAIRACRPPGGQLRPSRRDPRPAAGCAEPSPRVRAAARAGPLLTWRAVCDHGPPRCPTGTSGSATSSCSDRLARSEDSAPRRGRARPACPDRWTACHERSGAGTCRTSLRHERSSCRFASLAPKIRSCPGKPAVRTAHCVTNARELASLAPKTPLLGGAGQGRPVRTALRTNARELGWSIRSFEDDGGAGGDVVPAVDHRAGGGVDDVFGRRERGVDHAPPRAVIGDLAHVERRSAPTTRWRPRAARRPARSTPAPRPPAR